jgi:hypothetical protein
MAIDPIPHTAPDQKPYPYASDASSAAATTAAGAQRETTIDKETLRTELKLTQEELNKAIERAGKLDDEGDGPKILPTYDVMASLMLLLSQMARTLQETAVVQAASMDFPTKMQKLFAKLMGEVKLYDIKNLPPGLDKKYFNNDGTIKDDQLSNVLNQIGLANAQQNKLIEDLRILREMQGEDAKGIQSMINASDDAQKGMLDFMQTFLQKAREWLASIYR